MEIDIENIVPGNICFMKNIMLDIDKKAISSIKKCLPIQSMMSTWSLVYTRGAVILAIGFLDNIILLEALFF